MAIEREEIERLANDRDDEMAIMDRNVLARLRDVQLNNIVAKGHKLIKKDKKQTDPKLEDLPRIHRWEIALKNEKAKI